MPTVSTTAFAGRGQLAFVSSGRLYVLDGSAAGRPATLHTVAAPGGATAPAWSPDGRWLAFLVVPPSPYPVVSDPMGTLWLAHADGNAARPVLANAGPFSWSPVTDVLAVTVTNPASGRSWLCELRPGTPPHLVPGVTGPALWSPDGLAARLHHDPVQPAARLLRQQAGDHPRIGRHARGAAHLLEPGRAPGSGRLVPR